MNWLPTNIENYCVENSTRPSKVCDELYEYTVAQVPMAMMLIGPIQASFIGFLLRAINAKRVLEVGCFTGYSALAMAEQLPETGEVITLDINEETNRIAQSFWQKSEHGKKIHSLIGPARESFKVLKGSFDFIFIDADKTNYPHYFEAALSMLSPHGLIALDNSLRDGDVLKEKPDEGTLAIRELTQRIHSRNDLQSTLVPIRDGLLLVRKTQ